MRWLSMLLLLFVISCSRDIVPVTEHKRVIEKEEVVSKAPDALKSLFCFKCHSYERFAGTAGRFPHERHKEFYHCNQCHKMKMHYFIETDTSICRTCHSLGRFTYTASGMKTFFDHSTHSKRNTCRDCHPGVFVMKKGLNKMTMEDINKGLSCGVCHNGKRAFSADNCTACHEMG